MVDTRNTILASDGSRQLIPKFWQSKEAWVITGSFVGAGWYIGLSFIGLGIIFFLLWIFAGWGWSKTGDFRKTKK